MPSATNEILIDRPRDEVFEFLADPENDPRWRGGVLNLRRISGDGVGARYTQAVKGPGGRPITADIEITELTPAETIAFRTIAGPVRPRGRYVLTAADGGTQVRFELEAQLRGVKRLMSPMVQKTMNGEVGQLARQGCHRSAVNARTEGHARAPVRCVPRKASPDRLVPLISKRVRSWLLLQRARERQQPPPRRLNIRGSVSTA